MSFDRSDVEGISASFGEPSWVLERRLEAWGYFEKFEVPREKEEPWRYTNLARLRFDLDQFSASKPQAPGFQSEGLPGGVKFTDLATAVVRHEDLVKEHLFSTGAPDSHIFAALHGALFGGGVFLHVPKGVAVEVPLEVFPQAPEGGGSLFPHNLIVVEEGAEVTLFERVTGGGTDPSLVVSSTELIAAQASRVALASLQELGPKVWHLQTRRHLVERDVTFKDLVVSLGARFSRNEAETVMRGQGADVQMHGLYFASGGQHFDFRTLQDHAGPHCTSDLLYKGALRQDAHTVYSGLIHVRPEGMETDAYQTNRNLVLSDHARADSKPELEIENNDVRCSHGASVGQLNEDEIFYLVSRGIPRQTAEDLIVHGFFEEVLGKISNQHVREVVTQAIDDKMKA